MIGYTISPLDSNESILEKLNKLEKYLKDNPLCNLYIVKRAYPYGVGQIAYNDILSSPISPLVNSGDILLFSNGVACMVTAVDIDNNVVYYNVDDKVVLADGDHYVTDVEVTNPTPATAQIRLDIVGGTSVYSNIFNIGSGSGAGINSITVTESSGSATITIEDTEGNQFTSNSFTVGETNTDTLIDTITVTESSGTATITIEDTAGNQYTSNSFNVGGGGSETVYVNGTSIESTISGTVASGGSVGLGDSASAGSNSVAIGSDANANGLSVAVGIQSRTNTNGSGVAIGYQAQIIDGDNLYPSGTAVGYMAKVKGANSTAIGSGAQAGLDSSGQASERCVAVGDLAVASGDRSIQLGLGTNSTDRSLQFFDEQIVSKDTSNDPLKLSNNLLLNNALPTISSFTTNFATASSNGIQVTVDSNDSAHEQISLNHVSSDSSILEDKNILALYNYTDMTDPDNPVSEFTLCYAIMYNYDSNDNVCDCMVLQMGNTITM